jgi:hypothetical protein
MQTKQKTWKPTVAGILNIVNGSLCLLGVFGVTIGAIFLSASSYWWGMIERDVYPMTIGFIVGLLIAIAVFLTIIGILSLLGGISALQRKRWGLALAGSIAGIFCNSAILGILALIFNVMSKDEFTS